MLSSPPCVVGLNVDQTPTKEDMDSSLCDHLLLLEVVRREVETLPRTEMKESHAVTQGGM
jgi:hypothetical protein